MKELDERLDHEEAVDSPSSPETLSVWGLAWPSILNNILFAFVSIVALKAVGALGTEAVAAVGTGQRIFFFLQAVLMATATGTHALVARAIGANKPNEAAEVTLLSTIVAIFFGVSSALIFWVFGEEIIGAFGLDELSRKLAVDYLQISLSFVPGFAIMFIVGASLRAAGDVITPLIINLIVNIINVFLLIALVNGQFGFEALGVIGAAYAWGISFTIGSILSIAIWISNKIVIPMPSMKFYTFERLKQLIVISVPAGIESVVFNFGLLAYFWIISIYGNVPFAAYNVAINILMISFMIGHGFSIAGATLTGQYLGAENPVEARRSGWKSARLTVFSMTLVGIIIAIFSKPISGYFIEDQEVIRLTVIFLWIFALIQPLMGIEFSLGGALRGAGDTKSPLIITMIGLICFRLVFAFLFLILNMPVEVVFASLIADYLAKGILFTLRFKSGRWVNALN